MGDLLRVNSRIGYLEARIRAIEQPAAAAGPDGKREDFKQQVDYITNELNTLKQVVMSLQSRLESRISDLENNTATLLDRIVTTKEKLQPSFDPMAYEVRLANVETALVNMVGMGST